MVFTVSLPGGARDFEFEAYIRLLEKIGVNVANAQRVADPVTKKRWLYAWDKESAAKKFAADLRRDTENDKWQVYPLPHGDVPGPLGPIEILVSCRSDGCNYSLSPTSRNLILKSFPEANLAPNLFIATITQFDLEKAHGPILDQVAMILTGLSEPQIESLGGYRVVDPAGKRVFHDEPLKT